MIPIVFIFGGPKSKIAKLTGMIREVEEEIADEEERLAEDRDRYLGKEGDRKRIEKSEFNRLRLKHAERIRACRSRIRILIKSRLKLERKVREDEEEEEEEIEKEKRLERDLVQEDRKVVRRDRTEDEPKKVKLVKKAAVAAGSKEAVAAKERSPEEAKAYGWVRAFVKEYRVRVREDHPERKGGLELYANYPYVVTVVDQGAGEAMLVFSEPKSGALDAAFATKEQFALESVRDLFRTKIVSVGDWTADAARKAARTSLEADLRD